MAPLKVTPAPAGVLLLRERQLLLPGFCLFFFLLGLYALGRALVNAADDLNTWFGIAASLAFGGGGFLFTARVSHYAFLIRERRLAWRRRTPFGIRAGEVSFEQIRAVRVVAGPHSPSDVTYRIFLETSNGPFPLILGFIADRKGLESVAERIRGALAEGRSAA